MILITGHPRSGTGYVSQLCKAYGMDVGHEELGEHGISSWLFAPNVAYKPPFHQFDAPRAKLQFSHIISVIRNPIDIIASTAYTETNDHSKHWRKEFVFIDDSKNVIEQAAMSVVGWYKMISAQGIKTYRIEDIEETIKFLAWSDKTGSPNKAYNARPHPKLTITELKMAISDGLFNEVIKLSKSYEYCKD